MRSHLDGDAIAELPPEMPGGLTFHLPMELVALRDAGATDDIVLARRNERLAEAYAEGLVDPPLYRWAVGRYGPTASALLSQDPDRASAAVAEIEPLADGLAGAAFHGLIRLGYGAWQRDASEIARGLGYMRTRRQVLAAPVQTSNVPSRNRSSVDLPSSEKRAGATVFDLLNLAAGTVECSTPDDSRSPTARSLGLAAGALVQRNPSSFVAVHALTGFHALCELHLLVAGDAPNGTAQAPNGTAQAPSPAWWMSYATALRACRLLVESEPPEAVAGYDDALGTVNTIDDLVAAAVRSNETHDVKLAVSLRRLVRFGLFSEAEACSIGVSRLAAAHLR